jgi:hypothetical protein
VRKLAGLVTAVFLASCGGNVVVDGPAGTGGHGGAGGTTTNSTGTSIDVGSSSVSFSSGTGPGGCGSLHPSATPSCESCAQAMCCNQLLACDRGTPCGQTIQCAVNCPMNDKPCTDVCAQKFPGGVNGVNALNDCLGKCPPDTCGPADTVVCDSGLAASTIECDHCLTFECCPEAEACAGNPVCQKCLIANAPPSCAPSYAALAACKSMRCPAACP